MGRRRRRAAGCGATSDEAWGLGGPWPVAHARVLQQEDGAAVCVCVERVIAVNASNAVCRNQSNSSPSAWRGRLHQRRVVEAP